MLEQKELYDMLSQWSGINIDSKNQEYCIFEQLEINHPNDWYTIDHIPKIIYSVDKHSQLENQYPPAKKSYKKIVDRYLRFMNLIWAMDTLWLILI